MPTPFHETHEFDARSSEEVVKHFRRLLESDDDDGASMALVTYRGGLDEFYLGQHYACSADPLDRVTGAMLLGQLGWGDQTFQEESVDILISLLQDTDTRVVEAALNALGHRTFGRSIPFILPLAEHQDKKVRLAVAFSLGGRHADADAIRTLVMLAGDEDRDVRNWAAFGLGSMTELDTPELRDALAGLLSEEDDEIRGEALIGLARRHDARALPALVAELKGPFGGSWCLEAAELLAESSLLPLLIDLRGRVNEVDAAAFARDFEDAIAACGKIGDPQSPSD